MKNIWHDSNFAQVVGRNGYRIDNGPWVSQEDARMKAEREFWERCAAAAYADGSGTSSKEAAISADELLEEWRVRFTGRRQGAPAK